ncbi:MAG: UvrD-helicase domain-containing protein [Candidatus Vogelbacteria bacterium]|nr:UvrD-helicase domain-containing protein [Candidatus Vogelbacteria bacterium]
MYYLDTLNEAQKQAVLTTDGPLLVLAGAGAGKTKTVTHRILHLINQGIPARAIIAITFTNKAAKELRERLHQLLPEGNEPLLATTFHGLGVRILREHGLTIGVPKNFSIYDRGESTDVVKEVLIAQNIDPKKFEPKRFLGAISKAKSDGLMVNDYVPTTYDFFSKLVKPVWEKYENLLRERGGLDFDDLLLKTTILFRERPDILKHYQIKWSHVHIDEYQDTNGIQYELSRQLAGSKQNICVVGDIDQSIYSWRGADFENLLRFERDFDNVKTITLEENYRSTKIILEAANAVIVNNKKRKAKNLFTRGANGEQLTLSAYSTEADEALGIATIIEQLVGEGKVNYKEIALLYRTNFQSRILEEALIKNTIPYILLGTRFYERKEIKDLIAFIKAAINREDWGSIRRVINVPARGIGKTTLIKLAAGQYTELPAGTRQKVDQFYLLLDKIKLLTETSLPSSIIKEVLRLTGLEAELKKGSEDDIDRLENLRELVTVATAYDPHGSDGLFMLLADIALTSDQDDDNGQVDGVKLMTVHAAKGLEFDYVFITGLEQDLFPHAPIGTEERDNEEERRLFYVALTRARKKIYLSYTETRLVFGNRRFNIPSEFLSEIPNHLLTTETNRLSIVDF